MKIKEKLWCAKGIMIVFLTILLGQLLLGTASVLSAWKVLICFCVLSSGYRWGVEGGAVAGVVGGTVESLRQGELSALAILCLMGVLAGAFRRLGRGGSTAAFLCGAVAPGMLYAPEYLMGSAVELWAASFLFVLFPAEQLLWKSAEGPCKNRDTVQRRLEDVANSYGKLARSVGEIWQDENRMQNVAERPLLTEEIMPGHGENGWKYRFLESRETVAVQFREMERTLKEMAAQLDQAMDVTAQYEKQIHRSLRRRHLQLKELLVLEENGKRREAYVTVSSGKNGCVTAREIGDSVGKILHRSLRPADGGRTVVGKEPCRIRLIEDARYRLLSGLSRASKAEEELSGDNFSCHALPGERIMLCLSDGMGSGRRAYLESQLVMELLEDLLEAGFVPERAIHMINGLLLVRREQTPATLDLVLVDLYSGRAEFYKQGAVSSFIRRGNQVLQIESGALPVGMEQEVSPALTQVQLQEGDMIVMVTDGVLDSLAGEDKEAVMSEFLAATTKNNARELADEILEKSKGEGGLRDDMTVLTAGVWQK